MQKIYYIMVIGVENSGKTTFCESLKRLMIPTHSQTPFDKIRPTIGQNVVKIMSKPNVFILWDLGGHSCFRSVWKDYYSKTDGIIFCMDRYDLSRVDEAIKELNIIIDIAKLHDLPLLLLYTKMDLTHSFESNSSIMNIIKLSDLRQSTFIPVCSLSGYGVYTAFEWIVTKILMKTK